MWLRLAAMWGCTIREATARCDAAEFALWSALFQVDPWGEQRADLRTAIPARLMANALYSTKFDLQDFMPFAPPKPKPTTKELFDKFADVLRTINGNRGQSQHEGHR